MTATYNTIAPNVFAVGFEESLRGPRDWREWFTWIAMSATWRRDRPTVRPWCDGTVELAFGHPVSLDEERAILHELERYGPQHLRWRITAPMDDGARDCWP